MTAEVTAAYKGVSANILKASEKMPDADYEFKPAPPFRNYGQLIASCVVPTSADRAVRRRKG